ncbi:MAG: hypothetical protein DRQ62_11745 [Gammaproteobacteria bacterium]|nr:MAG: hypothetical protein DRQ62_11745 [Gammaproteobacteria bacterium]
MKINSTKNQHLYFINSVNSKFHILGLGLVYLALIACGKTYIPNTEENFSGTIKSNISNSSPDFQNAPTANKAAPNIILIVADDLGYSDIGSYGGEIKTPNLDKLAKDGIRFSHFTSNAICSSTRASLLTGLNHHSVGTGWLAEWDFGYPGYHGEMSSNTMTLAEILKQQGYATYMVGKWHLTNASNRSRIGPFDSWPQGRGFERYWGFLDGETSQWKPHALISGNEILPPQSYIDQDGFYLPDTLTDKAIAMIDDLRSHNNEKPFFLYYAMSTPHAPHHSKAADRKKYLGKYQQGWDKIRQQRLDQQKKMGLVPENTLLSDYTPGVIAWDKLSADQQKMYARLEENYAAFVDNMDQNIGRLLDHLESIGEKDNTLVIFLSDNGGSREVGIEGSSNALRFFHKKPSTTAQNLKDFERIGEIETHPHYPLGWMQVSNTPFIHSKRTSHDGGTRVPLIISWPEKIKNTGIRHQFHHVTDIAPTIMEALNLTLPTTYQGNNIKPMEGISLEYTFNDANAADQKTEQYYEIEGNRAYYKDGWIAIGPVDPGQTISDTQWQLFNLKDDFSASTNLAQKHPEKIIELDTLWWQAAEQFNVLPIINVPLLERPMYTKLWQDDNRSEFEFKQGMNTIQRFQGPFLPNHSYVIRAIVDRDDTSQQGVLVALGDLYSGYSLFIKDNQLYYEINIAHRVTQLISSQAVPVGKDIIIEYRFDKVPLAIAVTQGLFKDGMDFDRLSVLRGTGSLWINNEKVAEQELEYPVFAVWEGLDIGRDQITPVSHEYQAPFSFSGTLKSLSYHLD